MRNPHKPARAPAPAPRRPGAARRPGRPSRNSEALDLRDRILDAAEAQFAQHGYDAVSTREVAQRVGATSAMIHYYFHSKREMFDAVFARRADVLNRERLQALDAYETTAGDTPSVEKAIYAFLEPVLSKLATGDEGWRHYLALVAQVGNIHEWGGAVMTRSFDPVVQRLVSLVGCAFPKARQEDLYWGYHFLSGALLLTLSETDRIDRLSSGACRSNDIEAILPRLVEFGAAGFYRLCQPAQTPPARKGRPPGAKGG